MIRVRVAFAGVGGKERPGFDVKIVRHLSHHVRNILVRIELIGVGEKTPFQILRARTIDKRTRTDHERVRKNSVDIKDSSTPPGS